MGIIPSLFRATPRSLTQITRYLVLPISGTYDCAQKLTCTRRPEPECPACLEIAEITKIRAPPSRQSGRPDSTAAKFALVKDDTMRHGPADDSALPLIPELLQRTTDFASHRPWSTLGVVLVTALLSLGITVRFLSFKTSRSDLIDPQSEFQQRWLQYTERFGETADAVVVVEGSETGEIQAALDELGAAVDAEPQSFERALYRVDGRQLQTKALQYLTPRELDAGLARLESYGAMLDGHWERSGLEGYSRQLAEQISAPTVTEQSDALDRANRLSRSLHGFLVDSRQFSSPWPEVLPLTPGAHQFEPRYLLSDNGSMGFLLVVPRDTSRDFSGSSASLDRLRRLIEETSHRHPAVSISLTGIPVLEADEMRKSQSDMSIATLFSFLGVSALMLIFFRGVRHPLLAVAVLGVGITWSLGFTTLAVGHLNILSLSFATILIGLGIDYAICYLSRYLNLRQQGIELRPALVRSSSEVGTGILTVAVTTALAFLCSKFTNFQGVAELGIISAGGVILCAIATFTVLPALTVLVDRHITSQQVPTQFQGTWLRNLTARHPRALAGATLCVILLGGACTFRYHDGRIHSRVEYDANLLHLQARDIESVQVVNHIFESSNSSLLYAVSLADSPQSARRLRQQFEALPSVGRVEEVGSFLPVYPATETGLLVQAFHARLSGVGALPRGLPRVDPAAVGTALEELFVALRKANPGEDDPGLARLDGFLNELERMPLQQQMELLSGYQYAMLRALHEQFRALAAISDPTAVTIEDLPEALRRRFVSDQGDWLVAVYPRSQVWDEEPLEQFVNELRTVDPEVTGTPLQNYEAARQIRESYIDAAIYALVVTCIVLLIDTLEPGPRWVALIAPLGVVGFALVSFYGERPVDPVWLAGLYVGVALAVGAVLDFANFRNTCLALLPPLAGGVLMFGILGLIDLDLNPANLIVLPLLLGMGIDCGVHVLHDFRRQTGAYRTNPSTMNTVILTSTTTIVGFASMLGASHQGLVSIGLVLVIGVTCCMFVSLVTLPAILTLISRSSSAAQAGAPDDASDSERASRPHILPMPDVQRRRRSA
jgi:hopanoid biosynthesis associated RND transporter like protein HpnN